MSEQYIEKEVPKISMKEVLYSSKFDNNYNMRMVRKHLDTIYSVYDILHLDESKIDKLIDSKISKSILTDVSINIMNSLKTNTDCELFSIDNYDKVVDDNIDDVIKIDVPVIGDIGKKKIKNSVKSVGSKILKDIPSTSKITSKIPKIKRIIIYMFSNDNVRNILLILDIILIAFLIFLNKSLDILLDFSKLIIATDCILFTFNILFALYASHYTDEWLFIKRAINFYNYSLIYNELLFLIVSIILIILYKLIKRVI